MEAGRRILRQHGDDLAGVIIDPLTKNLGFLQVSDEFLKMVREETTALGALLIFDEVYSFRMGYQWRPGRVGCYSRPYCTWQGHWRRHAHWRGRRLKSIDGRAVRSARRSKMSHGGTFNANPMSMVAGAKAMELYDRAAHDRLAGLGERLRSGLRELLK